jgi:DNA-binding response OmpR family regulator
MTTKILLCDDEVHILRAAEIKLKRSGFDVRCAFDGQEGWEIVQSWQPDAVVTDLQMPKVDGLELVRRIRRCEATRELPIVMLTAKGYEASYRQAAEHLNIPLVLPKPFSAKELIRLLKELLKLDEPVAATACSAEIDS